MILNFTAEPILNKEYHFIRPMQDGWQMTATLIQHGPMKKTGWSERQRYYGIFLLDGEKRKAEIDWVGWYDGKYK